MAELLVKAKPHWKDSFSKEDVDKLKGDELDQYNSRSQIGDIIVVRPDGWEWGREECLPNFVVIKLKGVSVEEAKKYEQSIYEKSTEDGKPPKLLKHRKYSIPVSVVDKLKADSKTKKEIKIEKDIDDFKKSIKDKSK